MRIHARLFRFARLLPGLPLPRLPVLRERVGVRQWHGRPARVSDLALGRIIELQLIFLLLRRRHGRDARATASPPPSPGVPGEGERAVRIGGRQ